MTTESNISYAGWQLLLAFVGMLLLMTAQEVSSEEVIIDNNSSFENENGAYYPLTENELVDRIGVQQLFDPSLMSKEQFMQSMAESLEHHYGFPEEDTFYDESGVFKRCIFKDERCVIKAVVEGKCWNETSPTNARDHHYMTMNCCPVCGMMERLHQYTRCPADLDGTSPDSAFRQPGEFQGERSR